MAAIDVEAARAWLREAGEDQTSPPDVLDLAAAVMVARGGDRREAR